MDEKTRASSGKVHSWRIFLAQSPSFPLLKGTHGALEGESAGPTVSRPREAGLGGRADVSRELRNLDFHMNSSLDGVRSSICQ